MKSKAATQAELAAELGVTDRTVRHYLARGMPGCDSRGKYSVERCRSWVSANIRERDSAADCDLSELKERLIRAELGKAEQQEIKLRLANEITAQNLLPKDDVTLAVNEIILRVKQRLEQIPNDLESGFPAETRVENRQEAEERIRSILKEMAGWEVTPNEST